MLGKTGQELGKNGQKPGTNEEELEKNEGEPGKNGERFVMARKDEEGLGKYKDAPERDKRRVEKAEN